MQNLPNPAKPNPHFTGVSRPKWRRGWDSNKHYTRLSKVVHAALEEGLVLVAGDVLGDVGAGAFGVAHLACQGHVRTGW